MIPMSFDSRDDSFNANLDSNQMYSTSMCNTKNNV